MLGISKQAVWLWVEEVSLAYVYRLLRRHQWRKLGPRPRHVKAIPRPKKSLKKTPGPHQRSRSLRGGWHARETVVSRRGPMRLCLFPIPYRPRIPKRFMCHALWRRRMASRHALRVPKNMVLLPLLPYSPELNPVEHIWDYLRDAFGTKPLTPSRRLSIFSVRPSTPCSISRKWSAQWLASTG